MGDATPATPNLQQAVPFFGVADIQASLAFYVQGLGFAKKLEWAPQGRLRWCWIERDGVALMLQEFVATEHDPGRPEGRLGQGVTICIMCADALAIYREAKEQGLSPRRPFVGNGLWVTSLTDPDGYRLDFESPTDAPEETEYDETLT